MSTWVDVAPVIGTGSLDGFAIGALMSGACVLAVTATGGARARHAPVARDGGALAVTATRRARARQAPVARDGGALAAGAFGADTEPMARLDELDAQGGGRLAAGGDGTDAGGYRSRHRLGDPIPDGPLWGTALLDAAFPCGAPWDAAFPSGAPWDAALPGCAPWDAAFPGEGPRGAAPPDVTLPFEAFADWTSESVRQAEARRLPRHAAPSVSFGSRITGFRSKMTSLFAARVLASGGRG
jgi:hypothetical protein